MSRNKQRSLLFFRLLAFAHGIVGLVPLLGHLLIGGLLAGGAWWMPAGGFSLRWLLVIAVQLLLPVAWAAWLLLLAFRLWRPTPLLAAQLRWTHLGILPLGGLLCTWGFFAMRAAERSTAAGGGLLSPVAVVPLFLGAPLIALALASFFAASRIARLR